MKKICPICNIEKEEDKFYIKKRKRKNGTIYEYRESQCKSCKEGAKYLRRKARGDAYERMLERGRKRAKRAYQNNPNISKKRGKDFIQKKIDTGTFKKYWIKAKYGLTLDDFNNLREQQSFKCKICEKEEKDLGYVLHIDHCHETGKVRGLLCNECNTSLGILQKIIKKGIDKFIDYLK